MGLDVAEDLTGDVADLTLLGAEDDPAFERAEIETVRHLVDGAGFTDARDA